MSVYVMVWCNHAAGQQVLTATKRFLGTRFNNVPSIPPVLLNGAGQVCFPGGAIPNGMAALAAAYAEFDEETGINLQAPLAVANYHIVHVQLVNHGPFQTLYVQVNSLADLNLLANDINNNIANNTPVDDELASVQVVGSLAAPNTLGPSPLIPPGGWYQPVRMAALAGVFRAHNAQGWHQIGAGYVAPHLRQLVTQTLNAPHNWHLQSLHGLPAVVLAAAQAAAALAALPLAPPLVPVPPVGPVPVVVAPVVAPAMGMGRARNMSMFLAALLALGLAYAVHYYSQRVNSGQ